MKGCIRTNNEREFFSNECEIFFSSNGILHESSYTYTPQQNGILEHKHRHLLEVSHALKFQTSIPENLWGDCIVTTAYLINRMPSHVLNGKTPFEMLYGRKPEIHHLRVFSCLYYVTMVGPQDKMSPRACRCILMGYPSLQKGYRVLEPSTGDFFISRDVIFHEEIFHFRDESQSSENSDRTIDSNCFLSDEDLPYG